MCDFSPKAECVPTFTRESEHGPFVREAEKHDERWSEIELLLIVRVHREPRLFAVRCCFFFCTAEVNDDHPTSENGKLAAFASGRPAFQQHVKRAEGSDTTPPPRTHGKALSAE